MTSEQLLISILLVPLVGSIIVFASGAIHKRAPGILALLTGLATLGCGKLLIPAVQRSGQVVVTVPWIRMLGASAALRADALSLMAALTVAFIVTLAVVYSFGYYKNNPQSAVFYALVTAFLGGMIGAAVSSNTILFYLFWEMMLVPSYLLLAYWGEGKDTNKSSFKYFVFTHVGAVAMLAAILWIVSATGVTDVFAVGQVVADLPTGTLTALAGLFIFGFAVKMAIFPFHSWLPGAYDDAPLPATVIISGAMMSVGIYGMIRFPFSMFPHRILLKYQPLLMALAVLTQFYGGIMALTAKRIRRILAYSSISQMGYVLFGLATVSSLGVAGSIFHLLNHGLIKALLFMVAGAVILQTGRQSTDELGGLAPNMPATVWGCAVGALAIAGAPPLNGFQSEWMMLAGGFATQRWIFAVAALVASVFSAGYALLLLRRVFFGEKSPGTEGTKEASAWMWAPVVLLTAAIIVIGVLPGPFVSWIMGALKTVGFNLI